MFSGEYFLMEAPDHHRIADRKNRDEELVCEDASAPDSSVPLPYEHKMEATSTHWEDANPHEWMQ